MYKSSMSNLYVQERGREGGRGGGQGGGAEREAEGRRGRAGEARNVFATGFKKVTDITALKIILLSIPYRKSTSNLALRCTHVLKYTPHPCA